MPVVTLVMGEVYNIKATNVYCMVVNMLYYMRKEAKIWTFYCMHTRIEKQKNMSNIITVGFPLGGVCY